MSAVLCGAAGAVWLGTVLWLRAYRIWPLYYMLGVAGSVTALALAGRSALGLDTLLATSVAQTVHWIGTALDIPTRTFSHAPGTLLVLVIDQNVGWTALQIGVESSGLLELSALVSLLAWYPSWPAPAKLRLILIGAATTWLANIARVLLIVAVLHTFGKGSLVIAHTYLGKAVFFVLVVAILWRVLTAETMRRLAAAKAE